MQRLLTGTPIRSKSRNLSVANLAVEADVPRSYLTIQRTDLKDEFIKQVATLANTPAEMQKLQETNRGLKADVKRLREERDYWKTYTQLLARKLNVDTLKEYRDARDK